MHALVKLSHCWCGVHGEPGRHLRAMKRNKGAVLEGRCVCVCVCVRVCVHVFLTSIRLLINLIIRRQLNPR